jgi:hypothetical protein
MIEAFQRERNEWHSAAIREILGEYETWRQSSSQVPAEPLPPDGKPFDPYLGRIKGTVVPVSHPPTEDVVLGLQQVRYILKSVANGDNQSAAAPKAVEIIDAALTALQAPAEDEVERLREALQCAKGIICTPIARRKLGNLPTYTETERLIEAALHSNQEGEG